MPTSTYDFISSANLTSGSVNSVTFGSGGTLTQAYTDLILVTNGGSSGPADIHVRFNGDSSTNYTFQSMALVTGSGISGSRYTAGTEMSITTNTYFRAGFKNANHTTFLGYSLTGINKTALSKSMYDGTHIDYILSTWKNTNPVTSMQVLLSNNATWTSSSTMSLYGIKAA